ncbi:hypothetical protein SK128_007028, partial [Halocaridina rubra]
MCEGQIDSLPIKMGKEAWVKPPAVCCTTQVNSRKYIYVDSVLRHVLDVRPVVAPLSLSDDTDDDSCKKLLWSEGCEEPPVIDQGCDQCPRRITRPPVWRQDYVTD